VNAGFASHALPPEYPGVIVVDFFQKLFEIPGRIEIYVTVPPRIPVRPVQCPMSRFRIKSKLGDNNIYPFILVIKDWPRFEQCNVVTPEPEADSKSISYMMRDFLTAVFR